MTKKMHLRLTEEQMDYTIDVKGRKRYIVYTKYDRLGSPRVKAMCGNFADPNYQSDKLVATHNNCGRCSSYA